MCDGPPREARRTHVGLICTYIQTGIDGWRGRRASARRQITYRSLGTNSMNEEENNITWHIYTCVYIESN